MVVNKTTYHFVGYTRGWDIFEKEGKSERGCVEIEDWGTSGSICFGVSRKFHLHCTFKF